MAAADYATDAITPAPDAPRLSRGASLRDALSTLLAANRDAAVVHGANGTAGMITLDTIRAALHAL